MSMNALGKNKTQLLELNVKVIYTATIINLGIQYFDTSYTALFHCMQPDKHLFIDNLH